MHRKQTMTIEERCRLVTVSISDIIPSLLCNMTLKIPTQLMMRAYRRTVCIVHTKYVPRENVLESGAHSVAALHSRKRTGIELVLVSSYFIDMALGLYLFHMSHQNEAFSPAMRSTGIESIK